MLPLILAPGLSLLLFFSAWQVGSCGKWGAWQPLPFSQSNDWQLFLDLEGFCWRQMQLIAIYIAPRVYSFSCFPQQGEQYGALIHTVQRMLASPAKCQYGLLPHKVMVSESFLHYHWDPVSCTIRYHVLYAVFFTLKTSCLWHSQELIMNMSIMTITGLVSNQIFFPVY